MEKNQYELCIKVLKRLEKAGEAAIRRVFNSMLPKWQKKVIKGLEEASERAILNKLELRSKE